MDGLIGCQVDTELEGVADWVTWKFKVNVLLRAANPTPAPIEAKRNGDYEKYGLKEVPRHRAPLWKAREIVYIKYETISKYLGRTEALLNTLKSLGIEVNEIMAITKIIYESSRAVSTLRISLGVHACRARKIMDEMSSQLAGRRTAVQGESSNSSIAFQAHIMIAFNNKYACDEWVMDSEVTEHLSHDNHIFINYKYLDFAKHILICDDKVIETMGIGDDIRNPVTVNNLIEWYDRMGRREIEHVKPLFKRSEVEYTLDKTESSCIPSLKEQVHKELDPISEARG
ncbi:hypothetical protein PR048_014318 [Dryococelus australis]|uniref:Uncharacterized protein n=1 Tax=Dryococelus australis TaxID=614101 RepID=A0ABQ9HDW2_9NEOP|nr:hypothetical protein PR048_014318 [Dryococelus australis]